MLVGSLLTGPAHVSISPLLLHSPNIASISSDYVLVLMIIMMTLYFLKVIEN